MSILPNHRLGIGIFISACPLGLLVAAAFLLRVVSDTHVPVAKETSGATFGRYTAREACAYAEAMYYRLIPATKRTGYRWVARTGRSVVPDPAPESGVGTPVQRTWWVSRDDCTTDETQVQLTFDADSGEPLLFSRSEREHDPAEAPEKGTDTAIAVVLHHLDAFYGRYGESLRWRVEAQSARSDTRCGTRRFLLRRTDGGRLVHMTILERTGSLVYLRVHRLPRSVNL